MGHPNIHYIIQMMYDTSYKTRSTYTNIMSTFWNVYGNKFDVAKKLIF